MKSIGFFFLIQAPSGGQSSDLQKRVVTLEQENAQLKKGTVISDNCNIYSFYFVKKVKIWTQISRIRQCTVDGAGEQESMNELIRLILFLSEEVSLELSSSFGIAGMDIVLENSF